MYPRNLLFRHSKLRQRERRRPSCPTKSGSRLVWPSLSGTSDSGSASDSISSGVNSSGSTRPSKSRRIFFALSRSASEIQISIAASVGRRLLKKLLESGRVNGMSAFLRACFTLSNSVGSLPCQIGTIRTSFPGCSGVSSASTRGTPQSAHSVTPRMYSHLQLGQIMGGAF